MPPPRARSTCVDITRAQTSATSLFGGCSLRHITPQTDPSPGQPRPIGRLGRAGRPYRPCFPHAVHVATSSVLAVFTRATPATAVLEVHRPK